MEKDYGKIAIIENFNSNGEPTYKLIYNKYSKLPIKKEFYKGGMLNVAIECFSKTRYVRKITKYGFFKEIEEIIQYKKNGRIRTIKTFSGNKMKVDYFDEENKVIESEIFTVERYSYNKYFGIDY